MRHRSLQSTVGVLASTCWAIPFGQAAPAPQIFAVCGSQPNQPTIYFSGVLQGPAAGLQGFRDAFNEYLAQHYAYKGNVGCLPTNSAANAQNFINTRSTALRNAKRNVVETGWAETAPGVASIAGAATAVKATAVMQSSTASAVSTPAAGAAQGGGSAGGASQLTSVLSTIFGTGGGGSAGAGGSASGAKTGSSGAANGAGASGAGSPGSQNTLMQVSNSLASVFGSKSTGKSANGGASADAAPKSPPASAAGAGLGGAQWQTTKLVVYGCGRQDMQIACVTDLTNQNQKDTLVQSADVWKDAFIVDDRGDRHQRTSGFFLNVDGDQRPQLDISYGKSARFVLLFDGVQAKVQKVALRSQNGGLDVEEINLIVAGAAAQASHQ